MPGPACYPVPMRDTTSAAHAQALGLALAMRRTALGLSGRTLGKRVGVLHVTISRIECGVCLPSLPLLARIVAALGWEPDQLARLTEPMRRHDQHQAALAVWADANGPALALLLDALDGVRLDALAIEQFGAACRAIPVYQETRQAG
ncbi:MAG: helix-turn-helix domain-containing protein [Chloroflexota bacterium]